MLVVIIVAMILFIVGGMYLSLSREGRHEKRNREWYHR